MAVLATVPKMTPPRTRVLPGWPIPTVCNSFRESTATYHGKVWPWLGQRLVSYGWRIHSESRPGPSRFPPCSGATTSLRPRGAWQVAPPQHSWAVKPEEWWGMYFSSYLFIYIYILWCKLISVLDTYVYIYIRTVCIDLFQSACGTVLGWIEIDFEITGGLLMIFYYQPWLIVVPPMW